MKVTRATLGLSRGELAVLRRLRTPEKAQEFVYELKQNFEPNGDTCNSIRVVLRTRRAHCIEGAMVAACALWLNGEPPLLLDMQAVHDFDHVIALFRRRGRWGAISKTNGIGLRWRDPIYANLRELSMSYFHEYYNDRDRKSLRTYSRPFDLRRLDPKIWATAEDGAWDLIDALEATRHYDLVSGAQARALTRRDPFERRVGALLQYRKPKKKSPRALARRKKGSVPIF
ncbi:MAG TPA: hypothetical protein VL180_12970 [Burkholderiales bacterium]|nr:hypothetical protein [Burkholderiales bacterium]